LRQFHEQIEQSDIGPEPRHQAVNADDDHGELTKRM
jgi:hypothetical protein